MKTGYKNNLNILLSNRKIYIYTAAGFIHVTRKALFALLKNKPASYWFLYEIQNGIIKISI